MNIQQLRQSLKMKWLNYYQQNRSWLVKMRIWATYEGLRRPSSGFILATLSVLEPQFDQILTFILDLNNNPDQIVAALGLNFNPDEELSFTSSELLTFADQIFDDAVLETYTEDKVAQTVSVDTATNMVEATPGLEEKPVQGFVDKEEYVSSATVVDEKFASDRQPVTAVALATRGTSDRQPASLSQLLLSDKPPTDNPPPQRSVQFSPGTSLVMPREVPPQPKTLPAMTVGIKIPSDGKPGKIQLKNLVYPARPLPSTNATSLASWVDEFCQGSEWDAKEAIVVEF
jgi:hypothetical protein